MDDKTFNIEIVKNENGTYSVVYHIPEYAEKTEGVKKEKDARICAYMWCCECAQSFLNTADRILETIDGI